MKFSNSHRHLLNVSVALILMAQLIGCDDDKGPAGPCEHRYEDAILQITQARDSQSEELLSVIFLKEFKIDSTPVHVSALSQQHGENVEIQGDSLLCTPPCGLGTQAGHYEFTATAPGYTAIELSLDVQYDEFQGGCPSYSRGGLEVEIELAPR